MPEEINARQFTVELCNGSRPEGVLAQFVATQSPVDERDRASWASAFKSWSSGVTTKEG